MKKKNIAVLLAALCLTSGMVGCGSEDTKTPSNQNPPSENNNNNNNNNNTGDPTQGNNGKNQEEEIRAKLEEYKQNLQSKVSASFDSLLSSSQPFGTEIITKINNFSNQLVEGGSNITDLEAMKAYVDGADSKIENFVSTELKPAIKAEINTKVTTLIAEVSEGIDKTVISNTATEEIKKIDAETVVQNLNTTYNTVINNVKNFIDAKEEQYLNEVRDDIKNQYDTYVNAKIALIESEEIKAKLNAVVNEAHQSFEAPGVTAKVLQDNLENIVGIFNEKFEEFNKTAELQQYKTLCEQKFNNSFANLSTNQESFSQSLQACINGFMMGQTMNYSQMVAVEQIKPYYEALDTILTTFRTGSLIPCMKTEIKNNALSCLENLNNNGFTLTSQDEEYINYINSKVAELSDDIEITALRAAMEGIMTDVEEYLSGKADEEFSALLESRASKYEEDIQALLDRMNVGNVVETLLPLANSGKFYILTACSVEAIDTYEADERARFTSEAVKIYPSAVVSSIHAYFTPIINALPVDDDPDLQDDAWTELREKTQGILDLALDCNDIEEVVDYAERVPNLFQSLLDDRLENGYWG